MDWSGYMTGDHSALDHESCHVAAIPSGGFAVVKAVLGGITGTLALLGIYFSLLTVLSGWDFAQDQFLTYWPYVIALAIGFGVQLALFLYLRHRVHGAHSGKVVAATGGTSGTAMVACCAHYLVNLLPALGTTGLVSVISEYQIELFWVGIAANLFGILYVGRRLVIYLQEASK